MKQRTIFGGNANIWCFVLGSISFLSGFLLLLYSEELQTFIIKSALTLTPDSQAYEAWRINEPPLIMDIYFFNWTNAQDINKKGVKPRFEQVGPYRYKEIKEKINITWNSNDTISYRFVKRYHFMGKDSPRPLEDVITSLNLIPFVSRFIEVYFNKYLILLLI